jgi:SAM-dependent methyltransferase
MLKARLKVNRGRSAMVEVKELYQRADKLRPISITERQRATRELYDRLASERDGWLGRNRLFYNNDRRYMQFLVPPGQRVLELGCGEGQLLRSLQPSYGVGVDLSQEMINLAQKRAPAGWQASKWCAGEWRQLVPKRLLGIGIVLNKVVAPLPGIHRFCLRNYVVARSVRLPETAT